MDIFEWNRQDIASKMAEYEFNFEIVPNEVAGYTDMPFLDKPMSFEKDEIRLRDKFFYKQAFFFKGAALKNLNISDIFWVEDTIQRLQSGPALEQKVQDG